MLFLTRDKYSGDGEGVMPSRNEQIYSTRMLPADLEEIRTCLRANEKNRATAPLALGLTQQKDSLRYQHAMETAEQKLVCRLKVGNDLEHRFINLHRNCLRLIRQSIILSVDWKLRRQHCATTRSLYRQYWDMFATLSFWQASIWSWSLVTNYFTSCLAQWFVVRPSKSPLEESLQIQDNVTTSAAAICLPLYRKDNERRRYEQAVEFLVSGDFFAY